MAKDTKNTRKEVVHFYKTLWTPQLGSTYKEVKERSVDIPSFWKDLFSSWSGRVRPEYIMHINKNYYQQPDTAILLPDNKAYITKQDLNFRQAVDTFNRMYETAVDEKKIGGAINYLNYFK